MTGDELERAIQFLLETQSRNDAQIARLSGDSAELRALVREFAESTRLFAERADERLERPEQNAERADKRLERLGQNAERGDRHLERLDKAMAELAEGMNSLLHVVEFHVSDETRHRRPPG